MSGKTQWSSQQVLTVGPRGQRVLSLRMACRFTSAFYAQVVFGESSFFQFDLPRLGRHQTRMVHGSHPN